jgi:segregation and condensation protein A
VSSHEVDVLDIPLLPIVDGFVRVLTEQRDQIDFNQLSEFLLVAAILIELKSQKLLPGRESTDDDDELIGWEERDLLLARLLECRAYAAAADVFVAMAEQAARSMPREVGLPTTSPSTPPTSWPGSRRRSWPRPTCGGRPSARSPGSTSPT